MNQRLIAEALQTSVRVQMSARRWLHTMEELINAVHSAEPLLSESRHLPAELLPGHSKHQSHCI